MTKSRESLKAAEARKDRASGRTGPDDARNALRHSSETSIETRLKVQFRRPEAREALSSMRY